MEEIREPDYTDNQQETPKEDIASAGLPILEDQVEQLPEEQQLLPEGHILSDGEGNSYRIGGLISSGEISRYHAEVLSADDADASVPAIVMHASTEAGMNALCSVRDMLGSVESAMLPALESFLQADGSVDLVVEDPGALSLAEAMSSGMPIRRLVNILTQVAAGISAMHEAGWLHLGLRPDEIYLSRPVRIMGLEHVCHIGDRPGKPFYIPGYSAPELIEGEAVDVRADIYSLGALLYRAVTGTPIAETGADLITWQPPRPVPGIPQILNSCLGERDSRYPSVETLHTSLKTLSRRMQPQISCSIGASSTIGLEPSRTTNQDAYAYLTQGVGEDQGEGFRAVASVIDGMGGMAAGEVASRAAAESVTSQAAAVLSATGTLSSAEQAAVVRKWMQEANRRVVDTMAEKRVRGGCTMVIVCLIGTRLTIAHVGDCRIYRVRGDEIIQLTRDHSLAVALAMQGQIEMHEIRDHPDRNMVTRSLGDRHPMPDHFVDTLDVVTGRQYMELEGGDTLLLCSDGLWEPVSETEMLDCLRQHSPDLHSSAAAMVSMALDRGAPDNATVLLLRLDVRSTWDEEVTTNG